jgi:large subunit ribosomal protein L18
MNKEKYIVNQRSRRRQRIRKRVSGDAARPRLSVFRSSRHTYAQIIDDKAGVTIVAASTLSENFGDEVKHGGNKVAAAKVGEAVARKALATGIRQVRFDRGGYKYHGRIRALAEAARQAGLLF